MIVSNSDIQSLQMCERRFYWERLMELKPKGGYPAPMEIGTYGHSLMECFFQAIVDGGDYDSAVASCNSMVSETLENSTDELSIGKVSVYRNVLAFGAYFLSQPWEVVALEEKGSYAIDENLEFGFTPDIVCMWTSGPKKGLHFILDYKFTGQYWSDRQVNTSQQLPKYVAYRNKRVPHQKVRWAALVMLNTRASKTSDNNLFLVKWVPITKEKLETVVRENEVLMRRVGALYALPLAEANLAVTRTVVTYLCKLCVFADDICPADLEGRDTTKMIETMYEKNNYGYNN